MMFRCATIATLLISIASPTWASDRYPIDQELNQLSRQFKQKLPKLQKDRTYHDRRNATERQQIKAFVEAWLQVDPEVAPFLGMWTAIEESKSIYPSSTKGRVCIVDTFLADRGMGVSFSTATVVNNRLRSNDKTVSIKEGNFLATAFVYQGKARIYEYAHPRPLNNPATTDYLRNERKVIEQFKQAGCTSNMSIAGGIRPSAQVSTASSTPRPDTIALLASQDSGSPINIRDGASTSAYARHIGYAGDRVKILERSTGSDGQAWYRVQFEASGARGWVRGDFVELLK